MIIDINTIKFYKNNTKVRPPEQIKKIKRSIEEFGFRGGIKVTSDFTLIAGHGRVIALKELGYKEIDVDVVDNLTPEQIVAYRIADNKTAESAWGFGLLAEEIKSLQELNYDTSLTGFDNDEVSKMLDTLIENADDNDVIGPIGDNPIVKRGDVYRLGDHRLVCGDCTDLNAIELLLNGDVANVLITDPPYGVDYSAKNNAMSRFRSSKNININGLTI